MTQFVKLEKIVISESNAIEILLKSLNKLNLIPVNGNGKIEIIFQEGILLYTNDQKRTNINVKVSEYLD
jgi:hypothetical protein